MLSQRVDKNRVAFQAVRWHAGVSDAALHITASGNGILSWSHKKLISEDPRVAR